MFRLLKNIKLISILFLLFSSSAYAQDDEKLDYKKKTEKKEVGAVLDKLDADTTKVWKFGAITSVNFSQTSLSNWAAGGQQSASLVATAGLFANYSKKRHYWFSLLDASYGITKLESVPWRKTQDYWEFNTKYGYRFEKHWSATVFAEAISQFAPGYNYKNDSLGIKPVSRPFAPGYLNQGVGITYEMEKIGLSARISPLTAREILVLSNDIDETLYGVDSGKTVQMQLGASLRVNYLKELAPKNKYINPVLESRLFVFYDYLKTDKNPLINWRTKFDMKVFKVLSVGVLVHLIYDPTVLFKEKQSDGTFVEKKKLQLLQMVGLGIGYTFTSAK